MWILVQHVPTTAEFTDLLDLLDERETRSSERSLRAFAESAWPVVDQASPFVPNWHIDCICEHLQAVSAGQIKNLLFNVPPACGKSKLVSVIWPAWEWGPHAQVDSKRCGPWLRYLCTTYDAKLSIRDNRFCRALVKSEWYSTRWPIAWSEDQNAKIRYDTEAGGWRIATSIGGGGLGEHPHRKIIDDPHNTKEAESATDRQAAVDFYRRTLVMRGIALGAATVTIMQRLHQKDLSGYLIDQCKAEQNDLVHVCIPMHHNPKLRIFTSIGWKDPRKTAGALMWPAMMPENVIKSAEKELGSYAASGQLEQSPTPPEGGILKRAWWKYYTPNANGLPNVTLKRIVISADPALKPKQRNDFFCFHVWGLHGADRFLLRKDKGRWTEGEAIDRLETLHGWARSRAPGAGMVVAIENTAAGPEMIAALRKRITGVKAINVGGTRRDAYSGDKETRTHAVSPILEGGSVFVPGGPDATGTGYDDAVTPAWVQDTIDECAIFPTGAYDDEVDAFVIAMLELEHGSHVLAAAVNAPDHYTGKASAALMALRRQKRAKMVEANL